MKRVAPVNEDRSGPRDKDVRAHFFHAFSTAPAAQPFRAATAAHRQN